MSDSISLYSMTFLKYFIISVILHFVQYVQNDKTVPFDDPLTLERSSQFHCHKLKVCTPGGPKVCGYDESDAFLSEFEDMCGLHQANCKGIGNFHLIDMVVCDTKKSYVPQQNDTFEFSHFNIYYNPDTGKPRSVQNVTTENIKNLAHGLVKLVYGRFR